MFRKFLLAGLTVSVLALAGCDVYFGPDDGPDSYSYCDENGCYNCDEWGCWPDNNTTNPGTPGYGCTTNYECAAGCFCNLQGGQGYCEEAGFCNSDEQCASGFVCDDRASCVPDNGNNAGCTADSDCQGNSFCDESTGQCIPSSACNTAGDCSMGLDCVGGVCVPGTCTSDDQCMQGCYCNTDPNSPNGGECVETGVCQDDNDCVMANTKCDTERNTCVPNIPPPETCEQTGCPTGLECNAATGQCEQPENCTTNPGMCTPAETCNAGVCEDAVCSDINDESACAGRSDCGPVYGAICTDPSGNACTDGSPNCTCSGLTFIKCDPVAGT